MESVRTAKHMYCLLIFRILDMTPELIPSIVFIVVVIVSAINVSKNDEE